MSAQVGVNVLGEETPLGRSVLGPVGEITHQLASRACGDRNEVLQKLREVE